MLRPIGSLTSDKWRQDLGVTYEHLSYEMGFWNVEGSRIRGHFGDSHCHDQRGQSVVRTARLHHVRKRDDVWKIEAQA